MTKTNKLPKSWALVFFIVALIFALYVVQWLLQMAFYGLQSDSTTTALRPFQNHYLSFSRYYLTSEGALSHFSDDLTGIGRFLGFLIVDVFIWILVMVPLFFVKPLRKHYSTIVLSFTSILLLLTLYAALFVPPRKTIFEGKEMIIENTKWIINKTTTRVDITIIERFESDFLKEETTEDGTLMYSQIFVVVGGKRFLIGENQLTPENDKYKPSPAQKLEAQTATEALTKLLKTKI